MAAKKPVHPGGIVQRQCLEPLNISMSQAAKLLGVSRTTVRRLVTEKIGLSIEMAHRLSKVFGSSPETWYGIWVEYDLWRNRGLKKSLELTRHKRVKLNLDS